MRTCHAADAPLGQIGGASRILTDITSLKRRVLWMLSYSSVNGSPARIRTETMPPSATSPGISWIALLKLQDYEMAERTGHAPETFRFHPISNR